MNAKKIAEGSKLKPKKPTTSEAKKEKIKGLKGKVSVYNF